MADISATLRAGTITRILKADPDMKKNFSISKQSVEFLNQAACIFVRTLTKSCAVTAARSGKKGRLDVSQLEEVISNYPQLAFLENCLPKQEN